MAVATIEPVHRLLFRLADATCSLLAFSLAYSMLPWAKNVVVATLPYFAKVFAIFSPTLFGPGLPSWSELFWVWVVVSLAMALTLEYAGDEKPLLAQTSWRIARNLLLAMGVSLGAVSTVFYALRVPSYSRLFVCSYVTILFALAAGYRLLVRAAKSKRHKSGAAAPRVVIAGRPEGIERFLSVALKAPNPPGTTIAGCLLTGGHSEHLSLNHELVR